MSINETIPELIARLTRERDDAQESSNDWQEKYQQSMTREERACTQTLHAEEERDEARDAAQRMYDHFILYMRKCNAPAEQWAAGSVLLNAALPLNLRRVVENE